MVSLMQRRRMMMQSASSPAPIPTIDDYVQDGIVYWIDGIENTRSGHSTTAIRWEDLTSSHRDFRYNESSVIGDKYCIPNGEMDGAVRLFGITQSYTIEVVVQYVDNGATQFILPWNGNNYGTVWMGYNSGSPIIYFSAGSNGGCCGIEMTTTGINTYTGRGKSDISVNGVQQTILTSNSSWSNNNNFIGYYNSSYPRPCASKLYSIRVYNRLLSDAEMLLNRSIDAARFGNS